MSIRFHCKCGRRFEVPDGAAGKKAKCQSCGASFLVPPLRHAPVASAPPVAGSREPGRPRPIPQETVPPPGLLPDRPAARPIRDKRRGKSPGPVRVAVALAMAVMAAVTVDALVVLAIGARSASRNMAMVHGGWLALMVIGFFVAAAATKGSRLCAGILMGGALRGLLLNGPALLAMAALRTDLTADLRRVLQIAGWGALALGAVYLVLLLAGRRTRKYLSGHGGAVAGGAVIGFLFGSVVAATALPGPALLFTRTMARPGGVAFVARALKMPELLRKTKKTEKKNVLATMTANMNDIAMSLHAYMRQNHNYLPGDLGALVSKECPAEKFICPGSGKPAPRVDKATGRFLDPIDVIFLMPRYHLYDYDKGGNHDDLQGMIACYSDPNGHAGEGAVVIHPLVSATEYTPVQWLGKEELKQQLEETRKWLSRNKPRAPIKVEKND